MKLSILRAAFYCTVLCLALAGCTVYKEEPRPLSVYDASPRVIAEPASELVVEPPRTEVVYVAPPPAPEMVPVVEDEANIVIRVESDFHEPLRQYGRWEIVGGYGRCWIPTRVNSEWRPYCNGHWQRTEAGWYWASEEPWGWATYHYGRWDWSEDVGWFWVPQTQWAPAWVSWHRGGGYVGWAPMHPSAHWSEHGSIEVDVSVVSPRAYVIVEEKHFLKPVRPTTVVVNNTTVINNIVNITNIKIVNKTVINEGPRPEIIEQASGHKVQTISVHDLRRNQESMVAGVQRGRVSVPPSQLVPQNADRQTKEQAEHSQHDADQRTKELVQQAKRDAAQRNNDMAAQAKQETDRRNAALAEQVKQDADRRNRELAQQAQRDTERHGNELAQKEAAQHSKDLALKAQQDAGQHKKESIQQAQQDTDRRAKEKLIQTQHEAARRKNELAQKEAARHAEEAQENSKKDKSQSEPVDQSGH